MQEGVLAALYKKGEDDILNGFIFFIEQNNCWNI